MLEQLKTWLETRKNIEIEVNKKQRWDGYDSDKYKYYYKYNGVVLWSHKHYKWASQMSKCTPVKACISLKGFLQEEEQRSFYSEIERKNIVEVQQILEKVSGRIFLDEKVKYQVQERLIEKPKKWAKTIEAITDFYSKEVEFLLKEVDDILPLTKY